MSSTLIVASLPLKFRVPVFIVILVCASTGCRSVRDRDVRAPWDPQFSVTPTATGVGDLVEVHGVRNFRYAASDAYIPRYENRVYDLSQVRSVDFIVVPFRKNPDLAHTMLSFGFDDNQFLALSVEARRQVGQEYSAVRGALGQYELIYVLADERDVIPLRTRYRGDDTYIYRSNATPTQARALLIDVFDRANKLQQRPELYNTLTNNCTTNLRDHINRVMPGRIPWTHGTLLTGHADHVAYQLGLLERAEHENGTPFEQLRERARVNELANRYEHESDFSRLIRR